MSGRLVKLLPTRRRAIFLGLAALILALVAAFLAWPSLRCRVLGSTNDCTCGNCCLEGPIQGRTVRDLYSCVKLPSGSCHEQWNDVEYACSGGACRYAWDQGKCNTSANNCMPLLSNPQEVYCCSDDPPDTPEPATDIPTATSTATATPTPTRTPTATPTRTPTPLPPPNLNLSALYPVLVFYAPLVGEPAQTLNGSISGGVAPFDVSVHVVRPSGMDTVYSFQAGSTFMLDALSAGNPYFCTDEEGTWSAWAQLRDTAGQTATSPVVTWQVNWYPVHGLP